MRRSPIPQVGSHHTTIHTIHIQSPISSRQQVLHLNHQLSRMWVQQHTNQSQLLRWHQLTLSIQSSVNPVSAKCFRNNRTIAFFDEMLNKTNIIFILVVQEGPSGYSSTNPSYPKVVVYTPSGAQEKRTDSSRRMFEGDKFLHFISSQPVEWQEAFLNGFQLQTPRKKRDSSTKTCKWNIKVFTEPVIFTTITQGLHLLHGCLK